MMRYRIYEVITVEDTEWNRHLVGSANNFKSAKRKADEEYSDYLDKYYGIPKNNSIFYSQKERQDGLTEYYKWIVVDTEEDNKIVYQIY